MKKIKSLIEEANTILVLSHLSPDGDAIGSALAVYNTLLNINKNVDIILEDVPKIFSFLKGYDKIKQTSEIDSYDLVIVVDCSKVDRIGQDKNYFEHAKKTLNIDHHIRNTKFGDYNYISVTSPACSEYLVNIFDNLSYEITKEIAECLMVGILTDTGGFQYANVTSITYDFASRVSKLIDIPKIYKKVLSTKTLAQFNLTKIAIERLELIKNNKIAFTYLYKKDFELNNASYGDHEGIVDIGRNIEGMEVSIFAREIDDGFRVSLRSNGKVDVNQIAMSYNGGGHKESAGFDTTFSLLELKNNLVKEIEKQI